MGRTDEMNIFVPQSIQSKIELEEIGDVKRNMITPRLSTPIIGVIQDGLLGAYNLTNPDMKVDWKDAMNIVSYTTLDKFEELKKTGEMKGIDIFSLIIPSKINAIKSGLKVRNGKILEGRVAKPHLGSKQKNSLIHLIWDEYGVEETKKFLDNTQKLINNFNLLAGFTVGPGDMTITKELQNQMDNLFETKKLELDHLITDMENNPDLLDIETFEQNAYGEMNSVMGDTSKLVMNNLSPDNNFNMMATAGSKGGKINIGQMGGCVGQTAVEAKRVRKRVNKRTLPHFWKDDDSALARGFVQQSFLNGLEAKAFIFHNMGSREGLIDTAIKSVTSDTPVVILEEDMARRVLIGEWIDELLRKNSDEVRHYKERDMELLELKKTVYIPTADEEGTVSWGYIKNVTRHDPGKELYEIKTLGGREVIVTESKSLLIWNEEERKFIKTSTPDVKVGDYAPTTSRLAEPPQIKKYIDVTRYIPKEEAQLEKLELNEKNGKFIGLLLSEGNADISTDIVTITNTEEGVIEFVKEWFNKYDIPCKEESNTVSGYSTLLAKLLEELVGDGTRNKYVPNEAYIAPKEFIVGLINGYISGDGAITQDSIQVTSASKRITIGINMLLSRLGIFSEISKTEQKQNKLGTEDIADINMLSIRGQWAKIFSEEIELLSESKNEKLAIMRSSKMHRNYIEQNDVVLDKIISIDKVDVKLYPKVYDLTVPSTLNFGLANGLHVVDTSESGYIQRKLVKAMEDAMIKYDLTVRNANDKIIQYVYGDSGISTEKQYSHSFKLLTMGNKEVRDNYKLTSSELKTVGDLTNKANEEYYNKLLEMRDELRESVLKSTLDYMTLMNNFMLPVNFIRIISNIRNADVKSGDKLTAKYVLKRLDDMLEYENTMLSCMSRKEKKDKNSLKYRDELAAKTVFKFALHNFLAPKRSIIEYGFNKKKFDMVWDQIRKGFNRAVIEPGEMIGVVAAQSIGEPVTQLTLNSVDWKEKIILKDDKGETTIIEIGKYIDTYIEEHEDKVQRIEDNPSEEKGDTYYIDISDEEVYTISVNEDGVTSWNRVTALTKHLPMNADGTNDLVKIKTRLGREVTATKAKSFLTRIDNKIVPIRGDELEVGTLIPIMKNFPKTENKYMTHLLLEAYFPKTEYIYGSEIEKARRTKKEANDRGSRIWFKPNIGKLFTVPYARQDSLKKVLDGGIQQVYKDGCVYPKKGKFMVAEIPEDLELDRSFGFFMGAYLADGLSTGIYTSISKNDEEFRQIIIDFCDKYKIGYHLQKQFDKIQKGWTSIDVRIHSVLLAKLMIKLCNTGSSEKYIPDWAYTANDDFVKGLIDGYFSGDGCVARYNITASSVSEKLIDGMALLLTRFNIISRKGGPYQQTKNNRGSKNIKPHWTCSIRNENIHRFEQKIGLSMKTKSEKLKTMANTRFKFKNGIYDKIPGNNLSVLQGTVHRKEMKRLLKHVSVAEERSIIKRVLDSDVYYDEIMSIELVKPINTYVYDLTVDNDKTFILSNGLVQFDTFHHAGIGAMGTTTLGVPRMQELLSFSKNMKTPIMMIYMEEKYKKNGEVANKIASSIKHTVMEDIRRRVDIYYDPNPYKKGGFMEKDNVYNVFYSKHVTKRSCQSDITTLPWLIRIVLDREKLMNKSITLLDIKSKFCAYWEKRYRQTKGLRKDDKLLLEKVTQCAVLSNNDNDATPILHIRIDMTNYNMGSMIGFLDKFIEKFKLKGIDKIKDINGVASMRTINFKNEEKKIDTETEQVIYTAGINLTKIRYIHGIDLTRTMCNDVSEIYEHFGVEAARAALLHEMTTVFKGAGAPVNHQHLTILVDIMVNNGVLTSVDRHGLNKLDTDPLTRASFEKPIDQLLEAGIYGEKDYMKSVSSRIMAGLVINGGTGLCELTLDTKLLERSEYVEDLDQKYHKTFNKLTLDTVMMDIMEKKEFGIFVPAT